MKKTDKALFEQKFIIPAKQWFTLNYEKQTDEPQRVKEINVPINTRAIIIMRTNSKLDLEVRDSQYQFSGDKYKNPIILRYKNPYYVTKDMKWFDDDVFDWHGIYHLKGKRNMYKDVTYVDGFEIQTYEKGKYLFNMEFIVMVEGKSKEIRTSLIVNVI